MPSALPVAETEAGFLAAQWQMEYAIIPETAKKFFF